ncbi:Hypothetical predicted protein [Mytilus galloprovincialis]|uniref:G-protein coupled receptors family 1 profile domain-containing protein n=1 Tax=Mytilus galloprovincialis TaxID=29158 RepID=A0A8B6DCX0_MYTGA|nr:Hypothetical predicted protein [Mytilus galloprovincialis]
MSITRKSNHYRKYMIAVPLLLSVTINIPLLFWTRVFRFCGKKICTPDLRNIRQIALLLNATFTLLIPSAFLIFCYTMIVVRLCKRGTNVQYLTSAHSAFISCWLPSILAGLLNLYGHFEYGGWFDILIALAPLNSMLNPVIFFAFNHATFTSSSRLPLQRNTQELNTFSTKPIHYQE